jgi:ferredoxin
MATTITEECISCGACESECPNEAISLGEEIFVIDPDRCTECVGHNDTQLCAEACPVEVCVDDPDRRENEEILFERAEKIARDRGVTLELNDSTSHFRAA